jgi:hypothetical protein
MSQSDYIKFKRAATKLSIDNKSTGNKEAAVFESGDYIEFKQFNLENTILDSSPTYNYIVPSGRQIVFNMDKVVSSCPTFITCKNTNTRPNRVPMSASYFTPVPKPLNWKILNALEKTQFEACKCDTKLYRR